MKLNEINSNYIFYTEIELSEGEFIKLREPSIEELDGMNKAEDKERINELSKLFPICLVDHSFKKNDDDNKKASNEEVYKELRQSSSLFMEIITIWMNSLPFNKRLKKKQKLETSSK
jgi:hypothetical protein